MLLPELTRAPLEARLAPFRRPEGLAGTSGQRR